MKIKMDIPKPEIDEGDPLLPIMSLMLIIIPILVGNIAFYHFHAIRVNAPALNTADPNITDTQVKKEMNVMVRLKISEDDFSLDLLDESTGTIVMRKDIKRGGTGLVQLRKELETMTKEYPKLDVVLLSSYKELKYETLLSILDEGIKSIMQTQTKKSLLKVVMIPGEV